MRVDGEIYRLDEDKITMEKTYRHNIEIVVDRLKIREGIRSRLTEACESAISEGNGLVAAEVDGTLKTFSTKLACLYASLVLYL